MKGQRVTLRNLSLSDTSSLFNIISDRETMRYYPNPYSLEQTKNWIQRSIDSYKKYKYGLWAVELNSDRTFIGQCGISNQYVGIDPKPEIGFHIDKNYWGRGFGFESAQLAMNYGLRELELKSLWIFTAIDNAPARNIAIKLGMTSYKLFNKDFSETTIEHIAYKITKDQWKAQSNN